MNADRIKEIQSKTAYPDSTSVQRALFQIWNECSQESIARVKELDATIKQQETDSKLIKRAFAIAATENGASRSWLGMKPTPEEEWIDVYMDKASKGGVE